MKKYILRELELTINYLRNFDNLGATRKFWLTLLEKTNKIIGA